MNTPTRKLITEIDYFIAWLLFFICATTGGFGAGFIAGAAIGIICGAMHMDIGTIRITGAVAGFIVSLPISFLMFRLVVAKFIVEKVQAATNLPASGSQIYPPPPQ